MKDIDEDVKDYKKLLLLAIAIVGSGVILKNIGGGGEADEKIPVDPDDGGGKIKDRPSADAGGPYNGIVGKPIKFNAKRSDSDDVTYSWDFGDGSTGSGKTTSHTYAKADRYTVKLTVTDSDGLASKDTTYVEVSEAETEGDGDLFWYIVSSLGAVLTASLGLLFFRRRLYV